MDGRVSCDFTGAIPFTELTQAAAAVAGMQRVQVPSAPVSTADERTKFGDVWMTFARVWIAVYSRLRRVRALLLDFDAFALEWDKDVSAMAEG